MIAAKCSGKWMIVCLNHDPFADPLPELFLRGPKFFSIAAYHERRFLLLLFLFFSHGINQCNFLLRITIFGDTIREPCPLNRDTQCPKETSFARQLLIFLNFAKIFRKSNHVKAFPPTQCKTLQFDLSPVHLARGLRAWMPVPHSKLNQYGMLTCTGSCLRCRLFAFW